MLRACMSSCALLCVAQRAPECCETGGVERATSEHDMAITINDQRRRNAWLTQRVGEPEVFVDELRIRQPTLTRERRHRLPALADRHSDDDGIAAGSRLLLQPLERFDFRAARVTPGRPQANECHAPAQNGP